MLINRTPVHDDDEDETGGSSTPIWRRPRVLLISAVIAVALIYVFSRGGEPQRRQDAKKESDTFIGEVAAYQPPAKKITPVAKVQETDTPKQQPQPTQTPDPKPTVPSTPPPPATTASAPPPPIAPKGWPMPGASNQPAPPPLHTRMLVYALPPLAPPPAPAPEQPQTGLDFKASSIPGLKASAAIDDTYQLMPGLLTLVLDSAIQSDVPGIFYAHLPGPVYSTKGITLMGAGTRVVGRYQGMGKGSRMQAGSTVAYVPTEKGMVWVPLTGEQMGDELGRSGLSGEVDNHIAQRFLPAALLTLGGQALEVLQAEVSKGGNTYLNLNGGGGGGGGMTSLAQQILQAQINIPPTFTKHQGEWMALSLDQPVDFSAAYRISVANQGK